MQGYVINIEKATLDNDYYRRVIYTTPKSQLVLMSIPPNDNIHMEKHDLDQFIRIESGQGKLIMGDLAYDLYDGVAIVIPEGVWHEILNTSTQPLKLYSIYTPPEHPDQLIQVNNPM